MRATKRVVALFICLLMLVTAFPMGVLAAEEDDAVSVVSTDAEATSNYKPFHVHLDFDDVGTSKMSSYVPQKLEGTGVTYVGSETWINCTENGNSYISLQQADQTAFGLSAPDLFTNQPIEISFDTRLSYNKGSGTGALFFPLVRLSPSTSTSTGTANALVLKTPASASREDGNLMGQLRYTTGTGTAGESVLGTGYNLYAGTWYSFRLVYDASTTLGHVYMSEAGEAEQYLGGIDCYSLSTLDRILFGRGYGSTFVNMDLDNVRITAIDP